MPSELRGGFVLVSLHDPFFVVYLAELEERHPQFFYGFKVSYPEQVFFQGSDEPFSTAITFWHAYKGRRRFYSKPFDFFLKVMRHVLGAIIMPQAEAFSYIFSGCSKIVFDTLLDWLESLPPILAPRRVNTYAFPGAVIISDEYGGLAFFKRHSRCGNLPICGAVRN